MWRAHWLFLLAGCNRVFGVEDTGLVDAGQVDAAIPITLVQATASEAKTATVNALPFQNPLAAGDAVVAAVYVEGVSRAPMVKTISDDQGLTYTLVVGPIADPNPANLYIFAALGTTAGPDTVTVTTSSQASAIEIYIHEFHDLVSIGSGAGTTGTSAADVPDAMRSGSVDIAAPNALLFGFGVTNIASAGTTFATYSSFDNNVSEGLVITSPGSYEAFETPSGTGGTWTMLGAAFIGP